MPRDQLDSVLRHVRRVAGFSAAQELTDAELLGRYLSGCDEDAFATLVRRYGRLVRSVCRHVLHHEQDVDDTFQATFLIFASKAASIRKTASVASWLYGVAYRTAMNAKRARMRRSEEQRELEVCSKEQPVAEAALREVQAILDDEVNNLPEKYRTPFVLCCLEGKSRAEAARQLGWKEGTVFSRLARARKELQKRLSRRGVVLSAALCAVEVSRTVATAAVPPALVNGTIQAALSFTSGKAIAANLISAEVATLAKGVLLGMFSTKLKIATALLLAVGLMTGVGALAVHAWADKIVHAKQEISPKAAAQIPEAPKQAEEPIVRTVREGDALPAGAIHRLGSPRFRHDHGNTAWLATAFAHNGKMLATCAGTVRLWEPTTGKLLREIDGRFWTCGSMLFSPDDKVLAVQGERGISLLDPATGKLLHQLQGAALSRVFAFSPDGKSLATTGPSSGAKVGGNLSVSLWDTATGLQISILRGHGHLIHSAAFTADGRTLVTACYGNRVCRWNVARGELRQSFDLPLHEGRTACLSPDGGTLAIAPPWPAPQPGETDSLWDTETGQQRFTLPSGRSQADYGLAFSPDGKVLATDSTEAGTDQVTISLWNVETAERIAWFKVPTRAAFVLTFAPDGKTLLSSGLEPLVRLWDTASGKQLFAETGHAGAIASLSFTPDGRTLVSGADDGTLRVWDIAAARLRRPLSGHRWGIHALAIAPDGKTVLSGGADGCLRLHDLDTGEQRRRFVIDKQPQALREPEYQVRSIMVAADGRTAASWSATGLRERALFHVWDLATGEALVRRPDASGFGLRLFSPEAKLVLSCISTDPTGAGGMGGSLAIAGTPEPFGASTVVLHDVATGRQILPLPQPDGYGYVQAFAPDGRTLVTVTGKLRRPEGFPFDNHALHLWELATGKERLTIAPGKTGWEYRFEHVAFAPDGRTLATVRADGTFQLWDIATGAKLLSRTGYSARVNCLAFSPDSRVLASGHADSTILLWDLTSGGRAPRQPAKKFGAGQLERWWSDLADKDARKAHAAIWGLCSVPERAVNLFRDRLHPASAVPADKIRQRIADLDSDEFKRREAASAKLAALDDQARAALQAALKANPSVELRQRIEALLADPGLVRSADTLRHLRAVEVLERIGTPEAREVLRKLAAGAAAARETQEAGEALERLARPHAGAR